MRIKRRSPLAIATCLLIGVSVLLAGCASSAAREATAASEAAGPSPSPTPVQRPDVPAPPEQLTFEAGADLDPAVWLAGWHVQPIDMTNGFAVVYPRDDWEEKHLSNGCEGSRYHRFSPDGLDLTLDDRTLSNQYLAQLVDIPVADITAEGSDVAFPVIGRSPTTADFRVRAGSFSNGGSWLTAVRVFGTLKTALVIQLTCDPGPMTGATGQQMFNLLPKVVGGDALDVGLGRVDWNIVKTLTFDDGADLVASSGAGWVDAPLMEDASWTYDEGESDDGDWSYTSADGDCTAQFQQSRLDESYAPGDQEASDQLLTAWLEDPDSFVPDDAVDGAFALGVPGNDLVAMRVIEGSDATGKWVTAARALMGPLIGFTIKVTCTNGDPQTALRQVIAKSAIQVVP